MTTTVKIYKSVFPYDTWTDWAECKVEDVPTTLEDFKATNDFIRFRVIITINVKDVDFDTRLTIYNQETNEKEFTEFWDLIKKF